MIFEGVDVATLKLGPGHMPETPLPGQPGNAVISGHRTTYGRPFFDLDQLAVGDSIGVETALGFNTYTIRDILVVSPTDVWVTDPSRWRLAHTHDLQSQVLGGGATDNPSGTDLRS